jgi:hypothetical protein
MTRGSWLALATVVLLAGSAGAQSIGIFTNANATGCAADVGPAPWVDLYVVAILGGSATQMTGAQFQIRGVPEGWTPDNVLWVPDVGVAISMGHPMFPSALHSWVEGVNVAFSTCQTTATGGRIPLGRIVLLGAATPPRTHLRVDGFQLVPGDPHCPIFIGGGPVYAMSCVTGGDVVLNGPASTLCAMAIEQQTWGGVKELYR